MRRAPALVRVWVGPLLLAALAAGLVGGCAFLATGCAAPGDGLIPQPEPLSENERATYARKALQDSRAYVEQGRYEPAERATAHGLRLEPDNAELHRLRAQVLRELGREEEAREHARRADELAPPPAHPPSGPFAVSAADVTIVLLPPHQDDLARPERQPREWPHGEEAETLERRLRMRLPGASVVHYVPDTLPEARHWLDERAPRSALTLRVDRSFCDSSVKDGRFAVAWIRVAGATGDGGSSDPELVREVVSDPRMLGGCRREAVARALESVLGLPSVRAILAAPQPEPGRERWSARGIRQLFPILEERVQEEIDAGRELLAVGRVAAAAERFRRAVAIDPDHPDALAFLEEARLTLELSGDLAEARGHAGATAPGTGAESAGSFEPHYSASRRRAAEQRLREEQRRRDELLAALAVLEEDRFAPSSSVVGALRPIRTRDADAVGPRLARERAQGPVEARALYAPDGSVLARYYFAEGSDSPVLREEDTQDRGQPDRWIAYRSGMRHEVLEDTQGNGEPDLRLVFGESGQPLERIEIDADANGQPERVFRYTDGRLRSESRDTTGNGHLDRIEIFDAEGELALRTEDLNGDGNVDVRTTYRNGRIVRREILAPELVEEL